MRQDEKEDKKMKKEQNALKEFFNSLIVSIAFVFILTQWIVKPIQVNQSSMFPTLKDQQLGFSNILMYKLNGIKRFDVVIFFAPQIGDYLVKRVIALPFETVEFKDNVLYIDSIAQEENFINQAYHQEIMDKFGYFNRDFGPITLKENEVFLVGDNRMYSIDSRDYGPFSMDDILCKDVIIFYPFNEIHLVLGAAS